MLPIVHGFKFHFLIKHHCLPWDCPLLLVSPFLAFLDLSQAVGGLHGGSYNTVYRIITAFATMLYGNYLK